MTARALDHIVMPTAALSGARFRLVQLGFTIAPEGVHPFGTRNACVYLSDGTFLEPLAVTSSELVDLALAADNSFVAGDRRFRDTYGEEGVSSIVFATNDAKADAAEFERIGIAGGPMVQFSRPSLDDSGKQDLASFLLAFAASESAPAHYFFTCERQNVPDIDRSSLEAHQNGVVQICEVNIETPQSSSFASFIAKAGRSVATKKAPSLYEIVLANMKINVRQSASGTYQTRFTEIVFGVSDLSETVKLFDDNGVSYDLRDNELYTPAVVGQGADFIFKELS